MDVAPCLCCVVAAIFTGAFLAFFPLFAHRFTKGKKPPPKWIHPDEALASPPQEAGPHSEEVQSSEQK